MVDRDAEPPRPSVTSTLICTEPAWSGARHRAVASDVDPMKRPRGAVHLYESGSSSGSEAFARRRTSFSTSTSHGSHDTLTVGDRFGSGGDTELTPVRRDAQVGRGSGAVRRAAAGHRGRVLRRPPHPRAATRDGRIPDFPVTRSHPPASWPSAANSSICRTYRKTAGEESRRRSPVANRWMRPSCPKTGSTSPSLTVHLCLHTVPGNRECALMMVR